MSWQITGTSLKVNSLLKDTCKIFNIKTRVEEEEKEKMVFIAMKEDNS